MLNLKPARGLLPDLISPLMPDPGLWVMNAGTGDKLADSSRNGNDGSIIGGDPWISGRTGPAISLNGTSQTIEALSSSSLNFGTGNFSGGMLIRLTVDQIQILMSKRIVFPNLGWVFYLVNRRLRFAIEDADGGAVDVAASTTVLSLYVWYFVFFTADRSGLLTFYVNGLPAGGGGDISAENGDISNSHNFRIGSYADNTYWLGADVESVSLYNRIVPPSEVSRLFFSHYAMFERQSPAKFFFIPITPPEAANGPYPPNCTITATNEMIGAINPTGIISGTIEPVDIITGEISG